MSLDSIVTVTIDTQTTSPDQEGFGIPLVVGFHTENTDRVRYYTSLASLVSDGFATTDAIYKAVAACLAQNPRPERVGVGRLSTASVMTLDLTPVVQNTHLYTVTINDTAHTFTSDGSATAAEIVDALVTAINAGAQAAAVTASNVANVLHVISDVAGTLFELEIEYADFALSDVTPDTEGIAAQLAAISLEDDDWYCVVPVNRGQPMLEALAAYVETVKKIAVVVTGDSDVIASGSSDVASVLKAAAYERTAVLFSRTPFEYSNGAWAGDQLPNTPGSNTWAYKTLTGITPDTFSETERLRLVAKGCNYYSTVAGINITRDGVLAGGEFIDVTIGVDWFKARLQERIFGILANVKKIPFTDAGIALIENAVRAQLREAVGTGFLVDDENLQVIVPAAADVSDANKALRHLPDVTFQGTLAGAVHKMTLAGTISL